MSMPVPFAERLVSLASEQVGMREVGGENKGPPIHKFAGGREEPWCAHFVAWLFRSLGRPLPNDVVPSEKVASPNANVNKMWTTLVGAGWRVSEAQPGDIIFFTSLPPSLDRGRGAHVGIVSAVSKGVIQTIEGNRGDRVSRGSYSAADLRILGLARLPRDS